MKHTLTVSFLILICIIQPGFAQLISIDPPDAHTDSDVTITYDARLGNGELEGYEDDVYAYTGVITTDSHNDSDWKHVQNDWGEVNPNTLMTPVGEDLYEISFTVRDFYGIDEDETVLKLAFLFHNEDYSQVGRTADGGDIFIEINLQTPGAYVSHQLVDEKLQITAENGLLEIEYYTPSTAKAEYIPDDADLIDTTFTVVAEPETINPELSVTDEALSFSSSAMEVWVEKEPLRLHYISAGDTILADANGFAASPAGGSVDFDLDETVSFYGGGSRAIPVDRRGRNLRIYNEAHYGYGNNTPTLNISIPYVVSDSGYGLFFDNRYPADLDLGANQSDRIHYSTEGGRLRYFLIAGHGFDPIMQDYTRLTGHQKLPPLWSLGYIQSKYGYETETEARDIVNQILDADFPLDALILDLYWFGEESDMGDLDWDYGQWPQPEQMMSDFMDEGIQTILITEPYFTLESDNYDFLAENDYFGKNPDGEPYVLWGFWPGDASLLDITQSESREWMWDFYQARREEGVGGWWCDLGEPETHPHDMTHEFGEAKSVHNIYSLIWARFIDQNYETHYPEERLFNLIRSGYAGMQRYSTFPWSGDIQRSFDGLRAQIPLMLGAGMTGLGYMHSDVGGFVGNDGDGELFTRWVQFGVFAPILRMHGIGTTEPVNFSEPYKSIMRDYINLRYELLPYNYTLAYENSMTGIPLARQLNHYEVNNQSLSDVNDSYLWGKDFLVAPVLERGVNDRAVAFPEGKWLHYHDLSEYEGSQTYTVQVDMDDIPVFVRAGSFIPTTRPVQSTANYSADSLIVQYFPDQDVPETYGYLFDDDKSTPGTLAAEAFELLHFEGLYEEDDMEILLSLSGEGYAGAPDTRNMLFEVFRVETSPAKVSIDNIDIPEVFDQDDFLNENPAYYFDEDQEILYVNTSWDGADKTISITEGIVNHVVTQDTQEEGFYLHDPWPNPFTNQLTVQADVETSGAYDFMLQSTSGVIIRQEQREFATPGRNTFRWNFGDGLAPGMYILVMEGEDGRQVRRVIKR